MSPGKLAAQCAHASALYVEWYYRNVNRVPKASECVNLRHHLYREWMDSGHYTKLTLAVKNSEQMHTVDRYLQDRGYKTFMVIDEGRTEGTEFQPTALAVEVVDRDEERIQKIFGEFRLYTENSFQKLRTG